MSMDRNNNRGVVWRVAGSNLLGNKLYSFFTVLTIILAVSLISGLAMVQKSTEREKQQILNSMQHVMYMDVTDEQRKGLAEDALTEIMVPYKEGREVKEEGVKMYPFYIESHSSGIVTYTPTEGNVPEQENEIVVDRQLLKALVKEEKTGTKLEISFAEGERETFVVCGILDRDREMSTYPVYVSKAFAEKGKALRDIPYTALIRIADAGEMQMSEFAGVVNNLAVKYGIERNQVNINGTFENSLQNNSAALVLGGCHLQYILSVCDGQDTADRAAQNHRHDKKADKQDDLPGGPHAQQHCGTHRSSHRKCVCLSDQTGRFCSGGPFSDGIWSVCVRHSHGALFCEKTGENGRKRFPCGSSEICGRG